MPFGYFISDICKLIMLIGDYFIVVQCYGNSIFGLVLSGTNAIKKKCNLFIAISIKKTMM